MANLKQYAYFLKGNKLAIVENDITPENDPTSRDYGPDARSIRYKSPTEAVVNGLEIEYTYSPKYTLPANLEFGDSTGSNMRGFATWGVKDGYVTFFTPTASNTPGLENYSDLSADKYIVVRNHGTWNGLHKIKAATNTGYVQTYTKVSNVNLPDIQIDASVSNISLTDGTTYGRYTQSGGLVRWDQNFIKDDYVFITGTSGNASMGLFNILSPTENVGYFDVYKEYRFDNEYPGWQEGGTGPGSGPGVTEVTFAFGDILAVSSGTFTVNKVFVDPAYFIYNVDVLSDESDEIPISGYLSKAMVYYVKAQMAEDEGDPEKREYFMKEFRKKIEKQESARIYGPRIVSPGFNAIR